MGKRSPHRSSPPPKRSITTDSVDKRRCCYTEEEEEEEAPMEEYGDEFGFVDRALPDPLATLAEEMSRFDTDPKVLEDLSKVVDSGKETQIIWFTELRKAWDKTPPTTPLDAAKLVFKVMRQIHPHNLQALDLDGFLFHYSLPDSYKLLPPEIVSKIRSSGFPLVRKELTPSASAVRFPVDVTVRIERLEQMMTWIVGRMTDQLLQDGKPFPPPPRFDDRAGTSDTAYEDIGLAPGRDDDYAEDMGDERLEQMMTWMVGRMTDKLLQEGKPFPPPPRFDDRAGTSDTAYEDIGLAPGGDDDYAEDMGDD